LPSCAFKLVEKGKGVKMQSLKDEEIMLMYKNGQVEAMDELLLRYKKPICAFAFRLINDTAEAEDISQEVFLRLHQSKDRYSADGKFSTWIFTIAHHLCISRLRKKKWFVLWPRKSHDSEDLKDFASTNPSPQEASAKNDTQEIVKKCINSFPLLQREALILREYENLDYMEISKILNKSQGTIKTLIYRARQNLKTKLLVFVKESGGEYV